MGSRTDDIDELVAVVSTDSKIASPGPLGRPGCSSHVKGTTPGVPTMSEESENSDDSESRAGSDPVTIILAKVRNPLQTLEQTSEELFSGDEVSSALNLQPSVTNLSFGNLWKQVTNFLQLEGGAREEAISHDAHTLLDHFSNAYELIFWSILHKWPVY